MTLYVYVHHNGQVRHVLSKVHQQHQDRLHQLVTISNVYDQNNNLLFKGFNPCSPNPCNNGGTCYKHGSSYVCLCKSQYSGPTCTSAATTVTPPVTSPGSM